MLHISFNGKFHLQEAPLIGAANRAFRYGDGLFETMKMLDGKIIQQDGHFQRLFAGMKVLQFELPKHFTHENLLMAIEKLAKKNGHENAARIRLHIFRGNGGLYDVISHSPNYIIETWELPESNGQWNSNGLVAGIFEGVQKSCDMLCNIKHNNCLPYVLAALKAKQEKWNDAIVLNQFGRVADTSIANIFAIKNNTVFTPALGEGCVAGIMRKALIKYLQQNNFNFEELPVSIADVMEADEIFFTNSIYNMRWVQRMGNKIYGNSFTQKIYTAFCPTIG
jgi:branched-chain amino acid aminotransferase